MPTDYSDTRFVSEREPMESDTYRFPNSMDSMTEGRYLIVSMSIWVGGVFCGLYLPTEWPVADLVWHLWLIFGFVVAVSFPLISYLASFAVQRDVRDWYLPAKSDRKDIGSLQRHFRGYQKLWEDYFNPHIWLEMSKTMNKEPTMSNYYSDDWLSEFTKPTTLHGVSDLSPESFGESQREFKSAPDEVILRLQHHNQKLRIRDLTEAMLEHAFGENEPKKGRAFVILMGKVAEVIESTEVRGSTNHFEPTIRSQEKEIARSRLESLSRSWAREDGDADSTIPQMLTFFETSINRINDDEALIERSWQLERHRALVDILRSTDEKDCPHKEVASLVEQLGFLNRSVDPRSADHEYFVLATVAFVDLITDTRAKDFSDAIQKLRQFAKHHNHHYRYLLAEMGTLRSEIAKYKHIIVCMEYRYVLETLPRGKQTSIAEGLGVDEGNLSTSKAAPMWRATWELAVRKELKLMIRDLKSKDSSAPSPSSSSSSSDSSSSTSSLASEVPPSPLAALLRYEFDNWVESHPEGYEKITKYDLEITEAVIPYRTWRSYQRGLEFYSELSANIHGYGRTYDVEDESWLSSDALILKWLKPQVEKKDGGVVKIDWEKEWERRFGAERPDSDLDSLEKMGERGA